MTLWSKTITEILLISKVNFMIGIVFLIQMHKICVSSDKALDHVLISMKRKRISDYLGMVFKYPCIQ